MLPEGKNVEKNCTITDEVFPDAWGNEVRYRLKPFYLYVKLLCVLRIVAFIALVSCSKLLMKLFFIVFIIISLLPAELKRTPASVRALNF
jgi:hypothetical protein